MNFRRTTAAVLVSASAIRFRLGGIRRSEPTGGKRLMKAGFLPFAACVALAIAAEAQTDAGIPRLRRQGTAIQLVVDGAPLLIRGGELGNSTASDLERMRPMWAKLRAMHLNTV